MYAVALEQFFLWGVIFLLVIRVYTVIFEAIIVTVKAANAILDFKDRLIERRKRKLS